MGWLWRKRTESERQWDRITQTWTYREVYERKSYYDAVCAVVTRLVGNNPSRFPDIALMTENMVSQSKLAMLCAGKPTSALWPSDVDAISRMVGVPPETAWQEIEYTEQEIEQHPRRKDETVREFFLRVTRPIGGVEYGNPQPKRQHDDDCLNRMETTPPGDIGRHACGWDDRDTAPTWKPL